MDPEIQNGLEDYLHGQNAKARPKPMGAKPMGLMGSVDSAANFTQRLSAADGQTRLQVEAFRETAGLLHSLQAPEEVPLPSANFYARLIERIEAERAGNSFWSIFLNPQFSRRLVFASAALLVLLGVTLATTENDVGLFGTAAPELVEAQTFSAPQDLAMDSASQPIEAGLVSHNEADGHDQMLIELTAYTQ